MTDQPTVYLISDLHLGQGHDPSRNDWHVLEDFRADEAFCDFIEHISAGNKPVELVIAGDFIEYLQILPELGLKASKDHFGITEQESLQRTFVVLGQSSVATGHPDVFASLRRFIERGNRITMIAGNHDIDLLWKRVWLLLYYNLCPPGTADKLRLVPFSYTIGSADTGRIYIEHGQEHDRANRFGIQEQEPFVDDHGVERLKRCWGTLFVDKVYNQLEEQCWFIDNIKPISRVIKMGLRGDFAFTSTAMVLLAKFFLTKSSLLFGGVSFSVPGSESEETPQSTEAIINTVEDRELRAYLGQQLVQDPEFRASFEQEVQTFSNEEKQALMDMQQGLENQPWDNDIDAGAVSYGLFDSSDSEDDYQKAARAVMEQDPTISTVVMGHTHKAIDRFPITLSDGRTGYYFNSGTWTNHIIERLEPYTWEELANPDNYTSSLDYLCFTPNEQGEYQAELRSWQADR